MCPVTIKTPWWNWKSKCWFLWGSGSTYCSSIVCVFWFVFLFFLSMSKLLFLFLSVASGFYFAENTHFIFSRVCLCLCVCETARKSVSKYIIVNQRISGLALIVISASFSKRVWWSADWPAEDYSVSWIPWGVPGWADLLLAHTCATRPKDPSALSRIWCGGRHGMSCRLPGGLWQLWRRVRLCWQVRITVILTVNVCMCVLLAINIKKKKNPPLFGQKHNHEKKLQCLTQTGHKIEFGTIVCNSHKPGQAHEETLDCYWRSNKHNTSNPVRIAIS